MNVDPAKARKIHLIAICGTGMGTLAGMLAARGYEVSGSDQGIYPPMSDQLARAGIALAQGYDPSHVPPDADLVVIGNAVSRDNPEVQAVLTRGLPYGSFPEVLSEFFIHGRKSIVVAGTHGKTTTTAIVARVLDLAGLDPSFLVGGVLRDYDASFRLGRGEHFVSEGDEYDSAFFDKEPKFLHYRPDVLVVGNLEFDHGDIYKDLDQIKGKFVTLIGMLPKDGLLILGSESPAAVEVAAAAPCRVTTFGLAGGEDWTASRLASGEDAMEMDVVRGGAKVATVRATLVGEHNARNLLAAMAACDAAGVPPAWFAEAAARFGGVRRRQEIRGRARGVFVMDDFAHHPTAVAVTLASLRARYPERPIWAVFEPRSATSRRAAFQEEYAACFDAADRVVLAPLFAPDKIAADQRLDLDRLATDLGDRGRAVARPGGYVAILAYLLGAIGEGGPAPLVVFMSSGGFEDLPARLLDRLREE